MSSASGCARPSARRITVRTAGATASSSRRAACASPRRVASSHAASTSGAGLGTGGTYVPMTGSGGMPTGTGGMPAGTGGMSSPTATVSGGSSSMNSGTGGSTSPSQDSGVSDSGTSGSGGSGGSDASVTNDAGNTQDAVMLTPTEGLIGWASESGDGDSTTKGGMGGQEVTATTAQQLMDYASSSDPLIIHVQGTISAPTVQLA